MPGGLRGRRWSGGLAWVGPVRVAASCSKERALRTLLRPQCFTCAWCLIAVAGAGPARAQIDETIGRQGWWLPRNVFPAAQQIDVLFNVILWMTCIVCVGVLVVMAVFLVRYRDRPGRRGKFIHGNGRLEAVWTLIPTVILAMTAAFSQATWSSIKRPPVVGADENAPIHIEVVGKQFAWYFHYAGADGTLGQRRTDLVDLASGEPDQIIGLDRSAPGARDDIISGVMVVPVNTKILIKLASVDVLHSFFLPNFRIKQDAVPGLNASVWIESSKTSAMVIGTGPDEPEMFAYAKPFDIACAELCGQGHYKMRGKLYVVSQQQYEAFLAERALDLDLDYEDDD